MDLNALYQLAEQENIDVFNFPIHNKKAFCIDDGKLQLVAIDYSKLDTTIEEKEIIAEEVSHLKYKLLYFLTDYNNPNFASNVSKTEARAKRRAAEMLIPPEELNEALSKTTEIWELAEIFDTSETTVITAIESYKQKSLLKKI